MTDQRKQERVEFRTTQGELREIESAAVFLGINVSAFLRMSALSQAMEVLKSNRSITLSDRDRDIFLDALENPPNANQKLKDAINEYKHSRR